MTKIRMNFGGKPCSILFSMAPAARNAKDVLILISDDEMERDSPSYSPATPANYHFDTDQIGTVDSYNYPLVAQQFMTATYSNHADHPNIAAPSNDAIKANNSVMAAQSNDPCNESHPTNVAEEKYSFNADIFILIPIKRDDNHITHEDSTILDPSVACGLINTSMLPVDRCLYDWIDDTCDVLYKAEQCSFELSFSV